MKIVNMTTLTPDQLTTAAQLLTDSLSKGWATLAEAMDKIEERLIPENTLLAALEEGEVVGWGGILAPNYDGNVVELHPLCVKEDRRGLGIGRAIVLALEDAAREQGALTIHLGTDDEAEPGETSLSGCDLYEDLPGRLARFKPGGHASGFYRRLGYQIIGVMPDANGRGKPDIFMGKRLY